MMDKFMFWLTVCLAIGNMIQLPAEYFGWFGDINAPHFSHGSAALMWCLVGGLFARVVSLEKTVRHL